MKCANCGAENPAEQKFCNECAAPFKRRCAKCGYENAPTAKFCGECAAPARCYRGRRRRSPAAAVPPLGDSRRRRAGRSASLAIDGERKTVTALFADIKGSTELMEDLDPEEARAIVDPALKLMIDAVHRYDGYVVQSTGDGIFALFGAPVAHEDHPQRALYAALRMQEELRRYSAQVARGGQPADRGARRRQHRRSGGALDHDRRRADRVHADRAHHQPRLADAGARADRLDRDQRADAQAVSRATSRSSRWARPGSKASASRSMFMK